MLNNYIIHIVNIIIINLMKELIIHNIKVIKFQFIVVGLKFREQ